MRVLVLLCGALAATLLAVPAAAQTYPWCYVEYDRDAPGPSCAFVSREQCLMTAQGVSGGHCEPNYRYQPPVSAREGRPKPRRKARRPD